MTTHLNDTIMKRVLHLAAKGRGLVEPNPCVGCVIVKNGHVVGEGYHHIFGGPHAEIMALKQAGHRAHGADMFINLEPCSHHGKTPPCAPQVVQSGIKRVYVAMQDPNPIVSGRGISYLRRKGVKVLLGLGNKETKALNRPFIIRMEKKRPYTILKAAMTLDGKIATISGDSKWISAPLSRTFVHKLRAKSDAILVGKNTVKLDNPELTTHGFGKNPLRVILDSNAELNPSHQVFNTKNAPTLYVVSPKAKIKKSSKLSGVQILRNTLKFKQIDINKTVKYLFKYNVNQLLLEGGGEVSWSFLREKLVDEIYLFVAPIIIGGDTASTPISGKGVKSLKEAIDVSQLSPTKMGPDILLHGFIN